MRSRDRNLRKEILVILIVKLIAITAIWWAFIRDVRVDVDVAATARHFSGPEQPAVNPPQQGVLNAQ